MYLISVAKYRPHRPHHHECNDLQDFLAGGIVDGFRQRAVGYRPPRQIPPADRPHKISLFCRSFFCLNPVAGDAGGTWLFSGGLVRG
jgi:hypothetical protein